VAKIYNFLLAISINDSMNSVNVYKTENSADEKQYGNEIIIRFLPAIK
jgi:hypothetical protein